MTVSRGRLGLSVRIYSYIPRPDHGKAHDVHHPPSHQLVVGRVVGDIKETRFAGDRLAAPREVAAVQPQRAELVVPAPHPHRPYRHVAGQLRVGGLAAHLESAGTRNSKRSFPGLQSPWKIAMQKLVDSV